MSKKPTSPQRHHYQCTSRTIAATFAVILFMVSPAAMSHVGSPSTYTSTETERTGWAIHETLPGGERRVALVEPEVYERPQESSTDCWLACIRMHAATYGISDEALPLRGEQGFASKQKIRRLMKELLRDKNVKIVSSSSIDPRVMIRLLDAGHPPIVLFRVWRVPFLPITIEHACIPISVTYSTGGETPRITEMSFYDPFPPRLGGVCKYRNLALRRYVDEVIYSEPVSPRKSDKRNHGRVHQDDQ